MKKGPAPKPSPVRETSPAVANADTVRPHALDAVTAALDKKAEDPVLLDVREISSYADYVLLLSAESERQVDAIARGIEDKLRLRGLRLRSLEAAGESNWLLMDFGDLVIHLFYRDARGFYDLEGLWADAPRVSLTALGVVAGISR